MNPATATSSSTVHKAQQQRKRTSLACNICNKRKVKCDGLKPQCSNCSRFGVACSYDRVIKRRGPKPGFTSSVTQKFSAMEKKLLALVTVETGSPDSVSPQSESQVPNPATSIHSPSQAEILKELKIEKSVVKKAIEAQSESLSDDGHRSPSQSLIDLVREAIAPDEDGSPSSQDMESSEDDSHQIEALFPPVFSVFANQQPLQGQGATSSSLSPQGPFGQAPPFEVGQKLKISSSGDDLLPRIAAENPETDLISGKNDLIAQYQQQQLHHHSGKTAFDPTSSFFPALWLGQDSDPFFTSHLLAKNDRILVTPGQPQWKYLDAFYKQCYPFLQIIPKDEFYHWVPLASSFLLDAMYAMGARELGDLEAASMYFGKAKEGVFDVLLRPSFASIHDPSVLKYRLNDGLVFEKPNFSSSFLALALKIALSIRLCDEATINYEKYGIPVFTREQNVEIGRRLWWYLVIADTFESRQTKGLHFTSEDDYNTCMPSTDDVAWAKPGPSKDWVQPNSDCARAQLVILSDRATFCTALATRSYPALVLLLYRIDRRLLEQVQKFDSHSITDSEAEHAYQLIEASLASFYHTLDPSIKKMTESPYSESIRREAGPNYWAYLYVVARYYGIRIALSRARIAILERNHPVAAVKTIHLPVFKDIQGSAEEISKIVEKFAMGNPGYDTVFSPVMGPLVFESGVVHLLGSYVADNMEYKAQKIQRAQRHIQALYRIGERVARSLQLANILTCVVKAEITKSGPEQIEFIKSRVKEMLEELRPFG